MITPWVNVSFTVFCLQNSIKINDIQLNSSIRFEFRKTLVDQLNFVKATLAFW